MLAMPIQTERCARPPVIDKDDGTARRVGFELEFSGISLDQTARAVCAALGGTVTSATAAERDIHVDGLGDFIVELDWDYLKRLAAEQGVAATGGEWLDTLSQAAALLVPVEVVCPPIPVTEIDALQPMVAALRDAGAKGTEDTLIAAYGVHINPEIPRRDAATLQAYLTAFALLQWWLVEAHAVDPARRVSPYVDLYPEAYLLQVLSRPEPAMDDLFDDYLAHNATRNRALDLLPLLADLDEDRVRRTVDDPRIKARPTFHYRLPNCQIERPGWSLAGPWNTWCVVEELAQREGDRDALRSTFLAAERPLLGVSRRDWVAYMDRWLKDRGLA
jgi:hypothetical protein